MCRHEWTDLRITTPMTTTYTRSLPFPCSAYSMHAYQQTILRSETDSSNFDCNNARCWYSLCWYWVCCASNCTLLAALLCFFVIEVRACCDFAVNVTGKKVVSIVVIFNIEVASYFSVTQQGISVSLGVSFIDFSGARGKLPPLR